MVVVSPISGGPSEKLGILSGDRIVEVNGEDFASVGLTNSEVIEKLRGEKGSEVHVKIYRRGLFCKFSHELPILFLLLIFQ